MSTTPEVKLDLAAIPQTNATGYPPPFDAAVEGRWYRRLAPAAGLTRMGASHCTLLPGAFSSQRHWHREEDELVVMLDEEFGVRVSEGDDPSYMRNVNSLANFILQRQAAAA